MSALNPRVKPEILANVEVVNNIIQVLRYISLRRISARPLCTGRERKGVDMRGDIASSTRIVVGMPYPANTVTALE
jgi:hypothetical protein